MLSCDNMCFHMFSHVIMSYHVLSCLIMSYHVLSCLNRFFMLSCDNMCFSTLCGSALCHFLNLFFLFHLGMKILATG